MKGRRDHFKIFEIIRFWAGLPNTLKTYGMINSVSLPIIILDFFPHQDWHIIGLRRHYLFCDTIGQDCSGGC